MVKGGRRQSYRMSSCKEIRNGSRCYRPGTVFQWRDDSLIASKQHGSRPILPIENKNPRLLKRGFDDYEAFKKMCLLCYLMKKHAHALVWSPPGRWTPQISMLYLAFRSASGLLQYKKTGIYCKLGDTYRPELNPLPACRIFHLTSSRHGLPCLTCALC